MNPPNPPHLEQPLPTQPLKSVEEPSDRFPPLLRQRVFTWFGNLSQFGKLTVVTTATLAGLVVLSSALDLLSLFVKVAFVGAVAYGSYRIFFASKPEE